MSLWSIFSAFEDQATFLNGSIKYSANVQNTWPAIEGKLAICKAATNQSSTHLTNQTPTISSHRFQASFITDNTSFDLSTLVH